MSEEKKSSAAKNSPEWFVQGFLFRLGETFDRFVGRDWSPSSNLATSQLIDRLKRLVDSEVRVEDNRKYIPHNIRLKIQWDQFSIDSDDSLKRLETELLTALLDHINDMRYYTYAPLSLIVKSDYFIQGVKLFAGFELVEDQGRETAIGISVPKEIKETAEPRAVSKLSKRIELDVSLGAAITKQIHEFTTGDRKSIGRTKETDITINDPSISKLHAAIVLAQNGDFYLADTGSTNGTFIDDRRVAYGTSETINSGQQIKLGNVPVSITITVDESKPVTETNDDVYRVGEFEFSGTRSFSEAEASIPEPKNSEVEK